MISAVLFDIEGTIGDIAFVREILFPYSRTRVSTYLSAHWSSPDLALLIAGARELSGKPLASPEEATVQFHTWIDEDKKITPLKSLQGMIWRQGYVSGELKAHLYADAVDAMKLWHGQGKKLHIYSSGSVEAQLLYLRHSVAGDLTPLVSGYFDTLTGPKADPASYSRITQLIANPAASTVFFSDAPAETEAAASAGLNVFRIDRTHASGAVDKTSVIPVAASFRDLLLAI